MMSNTINAGMLRALVERIERVEEEIKTLNGDKSEIYKEARGHGYDVKAIRAVVAKRKLDSAEREEREAIFDLYWSALHGGQFVHVHTRVENIEKFDAETGEIKDEPETAAEVAGDYLREPDAADQGQIIREGDAPRETDRESGDASCPDAELQVGENVQVTTAARNDAGKQGVTAGETAPIPDDDVPAFLKKDMPRKTAADYRPHCQHPDACAASGLRHCYSCSKLIAARESEVA